jgi:hypothetical protein
MTEKIKITQEMREQVAELAGFGLTWVQIASAMKMNSRTLQRYCQQEYDDGKSKAIGQIAGTLFKKAREGNLTAILFYLKTQGGWRETNRTELTGADGAAIKTEETGKSTTLSAEHIAAITKALDKSC